VLAARAQASHYAKRKSGPDGNSYLAAFDDANSPDGYMNRNGVGFTNIDGVKTVYLNPGEEMEFMASKLPEPDLKAFMEVTDERLARGEVSSLSRFTRKVNNSWAGGRLEDQQDEPIIDQYRLAFTSAWQKINEWFIDALWITGMVDLPGYSQRNKMFWCEFRARFPGKLHINPQDTAKAREINISNGTFTRRQGCEEDGTDFDEIVSETFDEMKTIDEAAKQNGYTRDDFMRYISPAAKTVAGASNVNDSVPDDAPHAPPTPRNHVNRLFLNRMEANDATE